METCDVTFNEDDISLEGRSASCEKGDAISPEAIEMMAVGFYRPQELPPLCTGEGPSSTQVEPSTPQGQASSIEEPNASQPLPQDRHQQQPQVRQQPPPSDQGQYTSTSPDLSGMTSPDTTYPMNPESPDAHDDDGSLNNNNEGQGEDLNHDEDQEASQVPRIGYYYKKLTTLVSIIEEHFRRRQEQGVHPEATSKLL
jgi:hypothetical protein